MDVLISLNALKESIREARREKYRRFSHLGPGDLERLILVAPPVKNIAEIVRCQNCAHADPNVRTPSGSQWCKCLERFMDDQFFCAYGRNKESISLKI